MLNSNVQYNDRYIYEGGNPLVDPSTYHDITWQNTYSWWLLTASYVCEKDAMLRIDKMYDDAVLYTFHNFNKVETLNVLLSASPKVGIWNPIYSISMGKQFLDEHQLGITEKLGKPFFGIKLYNYFRFKHDWTINLDFYHQTQGHNYTYLREATSNLSMGVSKYFLKRSLYIRLSANDLLKTSYSKTTYYGSYVNMYRKNYADARKVSVSIRYYFNNAKAKYKGTGAGQEEKARL